MYSDRSLPALWRNLIPPYSVQKRNPSMERHGGGSTMTRALREPVGVKKTA
jgi:hypothetical protein